jgi:hypothetical protein
MPRNDAANSAGPSHHARSFGGRVVETIAEVLKVILGFGFLLLRVILGFGFLLLPVAFLKLVSWLDRQTDYYQRWAFSRVLLYAVGLVLWLGVALVLSFDDEFFDRLSDGMTRRLSAMERTLSALIAASPVLWLFIWSQLGVPPSRSFAYYCVYLMLLILVIRFNIKHRVTLLTRRHMCAAGSLAAMFLASTGFVIFPVIWAHVAMRLETDSFLTPTPVTPSPCNVEDVVIAHISDLHITENQRARDGKLRGNERMPLLLKRINGSGAA